MGADLKSTDQTVQVKLMVPDTTWFLAIQAVYQRENDLLVVAEVKQRGQAFGLTMITTVEDSITLKAPALPILTYIVGKTWGWENEEPYQFIQDLDELIPVLHHATLLYKKG